MESIKFNLFTCANSICALGRIGEDVIELLKAQQVCVLLESKPVDGVPEINELEVILGQVSLYVFSFPLCTFYLQIQLF